MIRQAIKGAVVGVLASEAAKLAKAALDAAARKLRKARAR